MKNYRRVLTGRVTDPGLSGLIKVYASTSSATEVGGRGGGEPEKKKDCGPGGRIPSLVQLLLPSVGDS